MNRDSGAARLGALTAFLAESGRPVKLEQENHAPLYILRQIFHWLGMSISRNESLYW
jgi:hypothetical protein